MLWYKFKRILIKKGETKMAKKIDKRKLATRIIASIMAVLMIVGMCGTLLYYIFGPK